MKKIVYTEQAPEAIGPYSQGIICGNLIFTSGQIPLNPKTMEVVPGGIAEQSRQVLLNLKAVLEKSGASISSIVKTTCFLSDMENFAEFNKIYAEIIGGELAPARSCVEVARLPKDVLVEVEAIAVIPD